MTVRIVRTESERRARQRQASDAWRARNPEKAKAADRLHHYANRERENAASLRHYYANRERLNRQRSAKKTGWSPEQYAEALAKQNGECAICSARPIGKALCGDHDHLTGKRRGLLCDRCNLGLGKFDDNVALLRAALIYLDSHKE